MSLPFDGILRLAGLQADFEVIDEKIFRKEGKAVYYLRRTKKHGTCAHCRSLNTGIHSYDKVQIRDQPAFGYKITWVLPRMTLRCYDCNRIGVEFHWLWRERRHFTWRYECQLSRMCEEMTNLSVSRLEGVPDTTVYRIDYELLQLRIERQQLPPLGPHYAMDEVYFHYFPDNDPRKPTSFVTNLLDLTHKRVITNALGRSLASAESCLLTGLSPEDRLAAQSFATDLHEAFHNGIRKHCPQAKIILDRFHIMKLFNKAMNDFRLHQMKLTTDDEEKRLLQGKYKWILLKNPDDLSHKDKLHLDDLKRLNERILEGCLIREHFVAFFESSCEETARTRWDILIKLVKQADIHEFNKFFLKDLMAWVPMLWDYFHHKTTSAVIEALNHKIKATKWAAYGYRNIRYFQLKILQRVGFLNSKYAPLPDQRPAYA